MSPRALAAFALALALAAGCRPTRDTPWEPVPPDPAQPAPSAWPTDAVGDGGAPADAGGTM